MTGQRVTILASTLLTCLVLAPASLAQTGGGTMVHRVNAGGPQVAGTPSWSGDTVAAPSPYVNAAATGNKTWSTSTAVNTTDPSVPAGTPATLFQSERYDESTAPELAWDFPVTAGSYEVRLYFAEIYSGITAAGQRVFDVLIENQLVLDNFDVFAAVGKNKGVVKKFTVTSDANLDIDFGHVKQNPTIKAIEIVRLGAVTPGQLSASPGALAFGDATVGSAPTRSVTLTNAGGAGDPSIVVESTAIGGTGADQFSDDFDDAGSVTLAPGASTQVTVRFAPTSVGAKTAVLQVGHSGTASPLEIALSGTGTAVSTTVGFGKSALKLETSTAPTSLQFGPDGRLYVAQFDGTIKAYKIVRSAANDFSVTETETINLVKAIPNHNDNGSLNATLTTRLVTGLLATGTAANPVLYVTSSDPRIGGGSSGTDQNLDTNSSMISRLTLSGSGWVKTDLVRGLPRSEENHSANGLALDPATNTLYVAQGGNTNQGAPSNNFALLPEFALSAAVLAVDLNAIGNTTYDLPTLDDEDRAGAVDAQDPFGGNDGKNQAKLVPLGPVRVHGAGFRNPYDLVRTQAGRLYTIDNGGNAGWGAVPAGEGPGGTCTNAVKEPGVTVPDSLHLIGGAGYYGGHPNPTRANPANTFNAGNPQSPVSAGNAVECDFLSPGAAGSPALTTFPYSTNGIAEYTAGNFGGAMRSNLLAAAYEPGNAIYRIVLNAAGTGIVSKDILFSTVGTKPLDVVAQGDAGPFPGTIWVADQGTGAIQVFEPNDFSGGGSQCTGADDASKDEDGDGYDNADEIDSGTSPCSSADRPADFDGDLTSNKNDPDDDGDGRPDTSDPFARDAKNGTATKLPVDYTWENDAPSPGGLLGLGFTGLMTNGSDYEALFDPTKMTAGGAAGATTVDQVSEGDALGSANTQAYGFQFGIDANPATTDTFTAHTRILAPFAGITPQDAQSMGLFIGTGDQDNYVKVVTSANGGTGGVQATSEVSGAATPGSPAAVAMPGADHVDLYLTVDPDAATVQPSYQVTRGGGAGPRAVLGAPTPIPATWLTGATGLAVGIISTSAGAAPPFPATWDFVKVAPEAAAPPPPPPPPPGLVAKDAFARTLTGGWGGAEIGGSWTPLASAASFAVNGAKGTVATPTGSAERLIHLPATSVRDVDVKAEIGFPSAAKGSGQLFTYLLARRQAGGAYYRIGLFVNTAGTISIRGQNASGTHLFGDVSTGLTFSAGSTYLLRVQADGANPTAVRVRAWKSGTAEPATWKVTASDSTKGPQVAGSLGVRTLNSTTAAATMTIDDFEAKPVPR
jgi:hypothetical protein